MDQVPNEDIMQSIRCKQKIEKQAIYPKVEISKLRATIAKQQNKLETFQHKSSFSFCLFH